MPPKAQPTAATPAAARKRRVPTQSERKTAPKKRAGASDLGAQFPPLGGFFSGSQSTRGRPKTQDLVHSLEVPLEYFYHGSTTQVQFTRRVIGGVCCQCNGSGIRVEVMRMGPMLQQMQAPCLACITERRVVLDVVVPKGSQDGHEIRFHRMAHEHPGYDPGDVIIKCKEKEHPIFKRKGADLFIEARISLSEALCGLQMDIVHLDGRKLRIRSVPGDTIKPMCTNFDPLAKRERRTKWEVMENSDCPSIENADTPDIDKLMKACESQLRRKGVSVGAFVVDAGAGRAYFKECSRRET